MYNYAIPNEINVQMKNFSIVFILYFFHSFYPPTVQSF